MRYEANTARPCQETRDTIPTRHAADSLTSSAELEQISSVNGESGSDVSSVSDENDDFNPFDFPATPASNAFTSEDLASDAAELSKIVLGEFISATVNAPNKKKRSGDFEDLTGSTNKRLKVVCFEKHMRIDLSPDADDPDTIIVAPPRPATYQHLACPFYVRDKESHRSCLTRADLRDIVQVKRHLCTAHRQPPYCPVCRETFVSTAVCDRHIRAVSCAPSNRPRPSGITVVQMQQLARRADAWASRELQWLSIWEIVFPGAALPLLSSSTGPALAVYLTGEAEAVVCQLRDFWSSEGTRIVSDFIAGKEPRGLPSSPDRDRRGKALGSVVLDRVVDRLVASCTQAENTSSGARGVTDLVLTALWRLAQSGS
ncbi:hypothetical protein F5B18DRAFT_611584 [Nemania serpens]|nr:hypothetical protein F5B18DRAFT_611584 [Nemania serpens]